MTQINDEIYNEPPQSDIAQRVAGWQHRDPETGKAQTDEIKFRYSEVVDKGFRPWLGNDPGPPQDFDWALPVLLRDGSETFDRGSSSTHWLSTGRDNDIVGYHRSVLPPKIEGPFPIEWDLEPAPSSVIAAVIGALSGAAVVALAAWAWIS